MKRWRRPPLQHPLAPAFARAVESLSTALSPATERNYNIAVRSFLVCLGAEHPKVTGLEQLHRDPHILGWMSRMRAQTPPLAAATCIGRLNAVRAICNELAWTHKLAELAQLIRREDIPRTPQSLPRPLTAEQDQLLQQELCVATILPEMSSCCCAIPGCASASVLTSLMTACTPQA